MGEVQRWNPSSFILADSESGFMAASLKKKKKEIENCYSPKPERSSIRDNCESGNLIAFMLEEIEILKGLNYLVKAGADENVSFWER